MTSSKAYVNAGIALAAAGAILFSSKGVIIKLAYENGMSTVEVMLFRMAFSAPVFALSAFLVARRQRLLISGKDWALTILCGVLSYYLATWLSFYGLSYISAQLERLILFTYPAFVVMGMAFLQRQLPSAKTVLAVVLSYAGIVTVFAKELDFAAAAGSAETQSDVWFGAFLVLCSALSYAASVIIAKPLIVRMGSVFFTGLAMSVSCAAIILHSAFTGALDVERLSLVAGSDNLGLMLLMGIFGTVLPAYMLNEAIARIGPDKAAILGTIGPVATAMMAVAILGEMFTIYHAGALILCSLGVGVLTRSKQS
ncbi:MAG: DMT family transporter [Kordiimonadaceae bacterium]|nr:DMT family transporter [Kordiimonadaceae bacterium]MBO6569363.1 DMT family transporter [Kordiimonadaceae bacterium]MBO6964838.1 DMT family transporter [Kordiimonadaceae bacterium]